MLNNIFDMNQKFDIPRKKRIISKRRILATTLCYDFVNYFYATVSRELP